jgi:tRNA dimethylallyltransferase
VTLVAVVGATGTGKSAFAIELAERIRSSGRPAEIINADAMQLYRGMDIGTAKVTVAERRGVPHHLIDVLDVTDEASVARYQRHARDAIVDVQARGGMAILVGGSGLYVSSVIHDLRFPGTDAAVRTRLEAELEAEGIGALHRRLLAIDGATAASVGTTNARRIVRALEVIELTGEPAAARLPDTPVPWQRSDVLMLHTPRQVLVERLDRRVERMWETGLIDEVRTLLAAGIERGATASRAIGYAQAIAEIRGALARDTAIEQTKRLTRNYARRQVGWFRRYHDAVTLDLTDSARAAGQLARIAAVD